MDYSRHLVLFSGGADSMYFVHREPTARYLLHYEGLNSFKTKVASSAAAELRRYFTIDPKKFERPPDGEIDEIHALSDTDMALSASIKAAHFGMSGIVICFNQDDLGIDIDAVTRILRRAEPQFEVLTPLINTPAKDIRSELQQKNIRYISCMVDDECGRCPKCRRGY